MPARLSSDTIGPVDVVVIDFPGNEFNGEVAPELMSLVESGAIRIIDLVFAMKNAEGDVDILEATSPALAALEALAGDANELLNDEDIDAFADALEPNSSALIVVFENTWSAKFAAAVRNSGGHLIHQSRIPHEVVAIAIDALNEGEAL